MERDWLRKSRQSDGQSTAMNQSAETNAAKKSERPL
jgi:hypothetical protein